MKLLSTLTLLLASFHFLAKQAMAAELRGTTTRELTGGEPAEGVEEKPSGEVPIQTVQVGDALNLSRPTSNGRVTQDTLNNETPHLGMNYSIATQGTFPSRNGDIVNSPVLGEVRMFAGTFPPAGWSFCEGQLLLISSNTALFSLLGSLYGGDGRTTFGLPDLRGRTAVHPDSNGPLLGRNGGTKSHVLTNENLPTTYQYVLESFA